MKSFYTAMRQCYRKKSFYAEKTARRRAAEILSESGVHLYAYGCSECGQYHLTKNPDAEGKVF